MGGAIPRRKVLVIGGVVKAKGEPGRNLLWENLTPAQRAELFLPIEAYLEQAAVLESARAAAETQRASNETGRQGAESTRAAAETQRAGNEVSRQSAESSRTTAEQGRGTAEAARVVAEAARVAAEELRQQEGSGALQTHIDNATVHVSTTDRQTWNTKVGDSPTFSAATTRANIASGNTFATILGKLSKWFTDLKAVAWSGSYNDLSNQPTAATLGAIPTSQRNAANGVAGLGSDSRVALANLPATLNTLSGIQATVSSLAAQSANILAVAAMNSRLSFITTIQATRTTMATMPTAGAYIRINATGPTAWTLSGTPPVGLVMLIVLHNNSASDFEQIIPNNGNPWNSANPSKVKVKAASFAEITLLNDDGNYKVAVREP